MMRPELLFIAVIFGAVGMAYIIYGKKQQRFTALFAGIVLCAVPYFVHSLIPLALIGILATALPFIIRS